MCGGGAIARFPISFGNRWVTHSRAPGRSIHPYDLYAVFRFLPNACVHACDVCVNAWIPRSAILLPSRALARVVSVYFAVFALGSRFHELLLSRFHGVNWVSRDNCVSPSGCTFFWVLFNFLHFSRQFRNSFCAGEGATKAAREKKIMDENSMEQNRGHRVSGKITSPWDLEPKIEDILLEGY